MKKGKVDPVSTAVMFVGKRVIHLNPKQQTRHSPMTVLLTQRTGVIYVRILIFY